MILARVRWQGITSLGGAHLVTPSGFASAVPDQSDWVPRALKLADRRGQSCRGSLATFLRFCGLGRQPPEYCTMYLCIWGTSQLPGDVVQWLQENRVALRDAISRYREQHHMWPHPLTLYESWAAGLVGSHGPKSSHGPVVQGGPVVQATGSSSSSSGPVVRGRAAREQPSAKHVLKKPSSSLKVNAKGK